jgi:hypothetical protein
MSTYHGTRQKERSAWVDFLALVVLLPVMFFGLDALLQWIAGVLA